MLVDQYVYFALDSESMSPADISRSIGVDADRERWRGSRDKERDIPRSHGWMIEPRSPQYEPNERGIGCYLLHAETADIVERLTPHASRIRKLVDDGAVSATLQFVRTFKKGELEHSSIGTGLHASDIAFLAAVGAALDIDEYDEVDDSEPPPITDDDGNTFHRLK